MKKNIFDSNDDYFLKFYNYSKNSHKKEFCNLINKISNKPSYLFSLNLFAK